MILSTYPGRADQIAHAVGLDALASVQNSLAGLAQEGFGVASPENLAVALNTQRISWPLADYISALDLLPMVWSWIYGAAGHDPHHAYLRVVPTADLSVTMGLSVSVLFICLVYNIKIKGVGGWAHELVSAPFGTSKNPVFAVILGVVNIAEQLISFTAKTVSHGMRLFGNMYAGELVFMLIALLGGSWAFSAEPASLMLLLLHVVAGWAWAVFHIIIILLQAFVFMMLTLVYIGQAHDAH